MKHSFLLAGLAAVSMTFYACGSSSPSDTEDDILSSAKEKDESSSSVEPESSSSLNIDIPAGARVATLDDLQRNMTLKGLFDRDIYMAAGEKHGLFSLWIPDTAWIAVPSDFDDGVIKFSSGVITSIKIDYDVISKMEKLVEKDSDHSMIFIVNEDDQLQYSLDGGEYKDVGETTVKTKSSIISRGDSLTSKRLVCSTDEDEQTTYSFYEGRYLAKVEKGETSSWSAGYYDIHRGKLLMRPMFYDKSVYALVSATVSSDYNLEISSEDIPCKKSEFEYKSVDAEKLAGEWEITEDGLDWSLDLRADRSYELKAFKGSENKAFKQGSWDVYGNLLLMKVSGCLGGKCTSAVMGAISDLDPKSGFTYEHSDPDEPLMPKTWEAPIYE